MTVCLGAKLADIRYTIRKGAGLNLLQTVEAEIDINGKIYWLEPLQITKTRRVLITLLAEPEANVSQHDAAAKLRQIADSMQANSFLGNPPKISREELHERD